MAVCAVPTLRIMASTVNGYPSSMLNRASVSGSVFVIEGGLSNGESFGNSNEKYLNSSANKVDAKNFRFNLVNSEVLASWFIKIWSIAVLTKMCEAIRICCLMSVKSDGIWQSFGSMFKARISKVEMMVSSSQGTNCFTA
jgi:hypothetical protein